LIGSELKIRFGGVQIGRALEILHDQQHIDLAVRRDRFVDLGHEALIILARHLSSDIAPMQVSVLSLRISNIASS
jgi:hypothetical protein